MSRVVRSERLNKAQSGSVVRRLTQMTVLVAVFLFLGHQTAGAQIAQAPGVSVSMTAMQLGNTVTYSIRLRNSSATDIGNLTLEGIVPDASAFRRQEITPLGAIPWGYKSGGSFEGAGAAVWQIDKLPQGASMGPLTYQVNVPADARPDALGAHALVQWQSPADGESVSAEAAPPPIDADGHTPAMPETPDGTTVAPVADAGGVKRFTLTASEVDQELLNYEGKRVVAKAYGYNGSTPGPTLVFTLGDRVAITVINQLPEATSVHWHGVILPNSMDGVPEAGEPSPLIQPGDQATYSFTVQQVGTFMYHSHTDGAKQDLLGLAGGLIFLPQREIGPRVDHDYIYFLAEWVLPQDLTPDKIADMPRTGSPVDTVNSVTATPEWGSGAFDFFTMNGKSFPNTSPLDVHLGDRVRIRFYNIGLQAHPMHLHGQDFLHTEQDGNAIAPDNQLQLNTIPVSPGETQAIEFYAVNPGIWPLHCHIAHHATNNLSSGLGGMATVVRIADDDTGW